MSVSTQDPTWCQTLGNTRLICVISGFRRYVDQICALLGYYAAQNGKFPTDVLGQPIGPILKGQEVVTELPLYVAQCPRRARSQPYRLMATRLLPSPSPGQSSGFYRICYLFLFNHYRLHSDTQLSREKLRVCEPQRHTNVLLFRCLAVIGQQETTWNCNYGTSPPSPLPSTSPRGLCLLSLDLQSNFTEVSSVFQYIPFRLYRMRASPETPYLLTL